MRVDKRLMGVKGDECQCGRRATVRHCTSCGSPRCYARMNRQHRFANGEVRFVEIQFRCQTCGHLFIEEEREFCEAPPVSPVLAQAKLKAIHDAVQTGEHLNPSDTRLAEALKDLLPSSGQDPRKAYDTLVYKLRVEFADRRASGEALTMSMDAYVEHRLKELQVQPPEQSSPTSEELSQSQADNSSLPLEHPIQLDDPQRDAIPIEERSIRLEWGRKKLAGRSLPDVEDYVRRRLAGELFE